MSNEQAINKLNVALSLLETKAEPEKTVQDLGKELEALAAHAEAQTVETVKGFMAGQVPQSVTEAIESLQRPPRIQVGFNPENALTVAVNLLRDAADDLEQKSAGIQDVINDVGIQPLAMVYAALFMSIGQRASGKSGLV